VEAVAKNCDRIFTEKLLQYLWKLNVVLIRVKPLVNRNIATPLSEIKIHSISDK